MNNSEQGKLPWISADNPPNKNGYYICWLTDEQGLIHYHVDTGWQNGFYNDKVTHYMPLIPPDESNQEDLETRLIKAMQQVNDLDVERLKTCQDEKVDILLNKQSNK